MNFGRRVDPPITEAQRTSFQATVGKLQEKQLPTEGELTHAQQPPPRFRNDGAFSLHLIRFVT